MTRVSIDSIKVARMDVCSEFVVNIPSTRVTEVKIHSMRLNRVNINPRRMIRVNIIMINSTSSTKKKGDKSESIRSKTKK